jgi:hypothetical protein
MAFLPAFSEVKSLRSKHGSVEYQRMEKTAFRAAKESFHCEKFRRQENFLFVFSPVIKSVPWYLRIQRSISHDQNLTLFFTQVCCFEFRSFVAKVPSVLVFYRTFVLFVCLSLYHCRKCVPGYTGYEF